MAIAFVRKTEGSVINNILTLNIEVSAGNDRVLVVGLAYKSNSVLTPTSIVFNGTENFNVERVAADGGNAQCFLWKLIAPSLTTANVVITMPAETRMVGYVALFNGVHQTIPFTANSIDAQGTDNAPTVDISSVANEMCVDILAQVSAGPNTAIATHTEICNGAATGGGTDTRGAGQYVVGQTTRTMNYSMSGADNWNICTGALQEPSGITQKNFSDILNLTSLTSATILFRLIDFVDTLSLISLTSDAKLHLVIDFLDLLAITSLTSDSKLNRITDFIDTLGLTSLTSDPKINLIKIFTDLLSLSSLTSDVKLFILKDFTDTLALTSLTSDPTLITGAIVNFADTLALTSLTSNVKLYLLKAFIDVLNITSLTSGAKLTIIKDFLDSVALTSLTSNPQLIAVINFLDSITLTSLTSDTVLIILKNFLDTLNITSLTSDPILSKLVNFIDTLNITSKTSDAKLYKLITFLDAITITSLTVAQLTIGNGVIDAIICSVFDITGVNSTIVDKNISSTIINNRVNSSILEKNVKGVIKDECSS